jgi:hypothetical protein
LPVENDPPARGLFDFDLCDLERLAEGAASPGRALDLPGEHAVASTEAGFRRGTALGHLLHDHSALPAGGVPAASRRRPQQQQQDGEAFRPAKDGSRKGHGGAGGGQACILQQSILLVGPEQFVRRLPLMGRGADFAACAIHRELRGVTRVRPASQENVDRISSGESSTPST